MQLNPRELNRYRRWSRPTLVLFCITGALVVGAPMLINYGCSPGGAGRGVAPRPRLLSMVQLSPDPSQRGWADRPVRLRFSRPVVSTGAVGRAVKKLPFAVKPAIELRARWSDRRTLVIRPRQRWRSATRYEFALRGALADVAAKRLLSFVNDPLRVVGVGGLGRNNVITGDRLWLRFNHAVWARDVERHCRLLVGVGLDLIALRSPAAKRTARQTGRRAHSIPVTLTRALDQTESYRLSCRGLVAAEGNAPLVHESKTWELRAPEPLRIEYASPVNGNPHSDSVEIRLNFSTEVTPEQIRRYVTLTPAAKSFTKATRGYRGRYWRWNIRLASQTAYRVRVDPNLRDVFGQRLGSERSFAFKTGDPEPRLAMRSGTFAVEAAGDGYGLWSRNITKLEVECAHVPPARLPGVLEADLAQTPYHSVSSQRKQIPWRKLGLRPRTLGIAVPSKPHQWLLHRLALDKICRGPKRGVYLAEVRAPELTKRRSHMWYQRPLRRVLLNVTDLGVLTKVGVASGVAWVTQLSSGRPVARARVTILDQHGKRLFRGWTDRQGLVRLPGRERLYGGKTQVREHDLRRRLVAVVESGRDQAVVRGNWADGMRIWNFGLTPDLGTGAARKIRGFILSDRGIYRPGEKVRFKGLVREIGPSGAPRVPRERQVEITVRDPKGTEILKRKLRLSAFGGFAFDHDLGRAARLGDYYVTATVAKQTFRERFGVQEFRKVTFEVGLAGAPRHVARGSKVEIGGRVRYLFGAPVQEGKVRWRVERRPHLVRPPGYLDYSFEDIDWRQRYHWGARRNSGSSLHADGRTVTTKDGDFSLALDDTAGAESTEAVDYIVQATVTDAADQSVTKRRVITAHPTAFRLGLHPQEYVQVVGRPFRAKVVAVTPRGRRVAAAAKLTWTRVHYDCQWSGPVRYAYRRCERKADAVWQRDVKIPAGATANESISPLRPGEYLLRVTARDARGRLVAAARYIWVIGAGEASWRGDESVRMTLLPSKERYQPGETARLVAQAPVGPQGAYALVTLERRGVVSARVEHLRSSGQGIAIPLRGNHAPNVFASVALARGRTGKGDRHRPRFRLGVINLPVSSVQRRLKVEVRTPRGTYEPGQRVDAVIRVTDHRGRPVRAELSVSAADEGVLQLIGYRTPDPLPAFYQPWGLGVQSATNWNRVSRMASVRQRNIEAGGGADDVGDAGPKVRSKFVSSAYWNPALVTDDRGLARFSLEAPDNLTAFRIMVSAADAGKRFGAGKHGFRVRKPLMAKPVLPRFFAAGDRAEVGVVVHNNTDKTGRATVSLRAAGFLTAATTRTVSVPKRRAVRVRFTGRAAFAPRARFTFSVRMGAHADALRQEVPIHRPLAWRTQTVAQGPVGRGQDVALTWPSDALGRDSYLEVQLDRTGMSQLSGGLRYLIRYPYGCLEQTLSKFIPLTKVADLAQSLGFSELQGPKIDGFIRAGVEKVSRQQTSSGHFSLWPFGPAYEHLTAFALYGLREAQRAGYRVDPEVLRRGRVALRKWAHAHVDRFARYQGATVAMAAAVLADLGHPDAGLNAKLYASRRSLPRYGLAFLLQAMHTARASARELSQLQTELTEALVVRDGTARIVEREDDLRRYYMSSSVRSSAIALGTLLRVDPSAAVVPQLAEGLLRRQAPTGQWSNTQENLYSLVALARYARRVGTGTTDVVVELDTKVLLKKRLRGRKVASVRLPLAQLAPGKLSIRAGGTARVSARLVVATPAATAVARDAGLRVTRAYLDPDSGKPLSRIKPGQLVRVRLEVTSPNARHYVAVVDPLPAGFEAQNPRLATSGGARRQRSVWTHVEMRDDRVHAFVDALPAGTHALTYLARATLPGHFIAAPARAELMYEPHVGGGTAARKVEIR